MKKIIYLQLIIIVIFSACTKNSKKKYNIKPVAKVKVTHFRTGYLHDYIELSGKTVYLNKSNLVAPINGYLTKVNIKQGDIVSKGELIFEMQTPEAFLMHKSDSSAVNYGIIKVYAPVNGRVVNLNVVNKNIFVDKGSVMCILLAYNDIKIQANIPFEYNKWAKLGDKCKIILPDNTEIQGQFSKTLPQINETSQTTKVLANITTNKFLPENMIVKVLINKSKKHKTQILPKSCLQTDALISKFWIMKLINDTIAIKIPVKIGIQNHDSVEIITPEFSANDLFISEGAYGLNDTSLIKIIK